mmetsp:Transcript_379/g.502  ORF Transcript_379/g.502 Transcript_379/m.502 type:complete len:207 (-) Transcript_379:1202-1822(-)
MSEDNGPAILPNTSKFKAAIQLMNEVEESKFPLLLNRIIKKLHSKKEQPFSEEEKEQLVDVLGLNLSQLNSILDSCAFIFEQAAYYTLHPNRLARQLHEAELNETQCIAFQKVWKAEGNNFISELKEQSLVPKVMDTVKYQLHLQMAQSNLSRLKEPTALFELTLNDTDPENDIAPEKVRVEFTHEQLFAFYQQLEQIQGQLDSLS